MARQQAGWVEIDSADNGIATATKAVATNKQHIVYSVSASFATTRAILLQIKDGTTVVWEGYVYDSDNIPFPKGLAITPGTACSAVLAASGSGIGKVNLHGVTI